jgi:AcrR family transcriptional regulator
MILLERQTDRRIIRTKRMIRDALTELMKEKGFEGITVRDLTTKADINRGTFYLHYQDKYDLLEQSEDEIIMEIEKIAFSLQNLSGKDGLSFFNQNEPIPFLVKLFEYFLNNSAFIKVILGPKGDPSFQVKIKEVMKKNILQNLSKRFKQEKMLVPEDYFFAYVSSAHLGVIQHWLNSGMKETPLEISFILTRMVFLGPGHVAGLLGSERNNQ